MWQNRKCEFGGRAPFSRDSNKQHDWVVFTRPYRHCCICSANYCKFCLISLLVWLVDVIALFLVMWPLSWYCSLWCGRYRGTSFVCHFHWKWGQLVLFCSRKSWLYSLFYTACRQPVILCLCSVTASSVQPCVATTLSYTTQRRKCCLPPVPPLSPATLDMTFCLWKPLPHLPPTFLSLQLITRLSHLGIARNVPRKPRRSDREEEGRRNGGRSKWSSVFVIDFHPILPALQPPVNTPLPYHLPLHPVTVTTSQPPRSALRFVPLTDSCFTFPLVLPQPKTHSLSASSIIIMEICKAPTLRLKALNKHTHIIYIEMENVIKK